MMPRYTNKNMLLFTRQNRIRLVYNIDRFLRNTSKVEDKVYLLLLFLTGARPSELYSNHPRHGIIGIRKLDFEVRSSSPRGGKMLFISIPTLKRRSEEIYTREIPLPLRGGSIARYARLLLHLVNTQYLESEYVVGVPRFEYPSKVWYYVLKWTDGEYPPYYFRHNRLTQVWLASKDLNLVMYWKGAADVRSAQAYMHVTGDVLVDAARSMDLLASGRVNDNDSMADDNHGSIRISRAGKISKKDFEYALKTGSLHIEDDPGTGMARVEEHPGTSSTSTTSSIDTGGDAERLREDIINSGLGSIISSDDESLIVSVSRDKRELLERILSDDD